MIKYEKYEFCKDINCHLLVDHCLVKQIDADMFHHGCPHSAKSFHKWLELNGFQIVKLPASEESKVQRGQAGECCACKYEHTQMLCGLSRDSCNYTPAG